MNKSVIVQGTFILIIYYVTAKILSFAVETLIASKLGATANTDAYYLVDSIINFLAQILSIGIWKVFMPEYKICLINNDSDRANELANQLILIFFIFSILLSLVLILFPRSVIRIFAPGFDTFSIGYSSSVLHILAFVLIFGTITTFPSVMLQSRSLFSKSQMKEITIFIPPILYLSFWASKYGIIGLAVSVLTGYILAAITQYMFLRPFFVFRLPSKIWDTRMWQILRLYPIACLNAVFIQLNSIIDKMFSSTLAVGTITFLNYGSKVIHLFDGVFSTAISVAVFPHLTEIISKGDIKTFRNFFNKYLLIISAVILPTTAIICIFSEELIAILFGYGKFGILAVHTTAIVLFMYGFGLLGMALSTMLNDVFYIKKQINFLLITTFINIVCNIILDFLFIGRFGVAGLSLATTISLYISLIIKIIYIRRMLSISRDILIKICSVCLYVIICTCLVLILFHIINYNFTIYAKIIVGITFYSVLYIPMLLSNKYYRHEWINIISILQNKISH